MTPDGLPVRPETPVRYDDIVAGCRFEAPLYVTRPALPSLDAYRAKLDAIWERQWLTNKGAMHDELERRLAERLGVQHVSLLCNGTIALMVALQALGIQGGEVVTTPFTFPATPHVLHWNGVRPVFCDIEPETLAIDPERLAELMSPDTRAILPVHVYGYPCRLDAIEAVAQRHGVPVVYDAAHTFGAQFGGKALSAYGEMGVLSFHATKLFTTVEGGAIVASTAEQKQRIDFLKNFGIADEETVIGPGINGKMNELQAAFGLLELDIVDDEIERRGMVDEVYRRELEGVSGLRMLVRPPDYEPNHAYFPVFINEAQFGMTRDALHAVLRECNVVTRKYFHPLCSHYPCYADLPSARPALLPVAETTAREVLCLPIYGAMGGESAQRVASAIRAIGERARA